ncbi:MAG: murein L,D-transpeptidase catalytic domain family protein [Pseudoxanthomonas sp.]
MIRFVLTMLVAMTVAAPYGDAHAPGKTDLPVTAAIKPDATSMGATTQPIPHTPGSRLSLIAPGANPEVLSLAISAMECAQSHGTGAGATRLAVIDYSLSSLKPRLWVFDLARPELLYQEVVAHGQGSGDDVPTRFSNNDGSHQSSLGLFYTRDTYQGHNGYSMRMQGLEPGVNDAAMARAIVMHGADYVNPEGGKRMGRLGRSWGCPALRKAVAKPIIDLLKDGQFVFSYYPDQAWLARSALLNCSNSRVAAGSTDRRGKAH